MNDHHSSGFPDLKLQKRRTRRLLFILFTLVQRRWPALDLLLYPAGLIISSIF